MALPLFHEDTTLTNDEERRLIENEAVIERGFKTFAEVGAALLDIRDSRLYRASHRAFEDYCRERWGIQRAHAYRLIDAAEVMGNLSPIGDNFPANESQARPLAQLPPEQQPAAWQRAQEIAQSEGRPLTAAHVDTAVREFKSPAEPLPFVPQPATNGTHDTPDAGDNWDDEPLTAYEEQVAAVHIAPSVPAPEPAAPMAVHFSSATPEWYTPRHIVERVVDLFGHIDLDPCSNDHGDAANVPARVHFVREENGLTQSWRVDPSEDDHGEISEAVRVYMNPPYGDEIAAWIDRLVNAYESREITEAIALLPARPDTGWWKRLRAHPVCFVTGRLKFSGSEHSAPFPSAIVYLGNDLNGFKDAFEDIGEIRPAAL